MNEIVLYQTEDGKVKLDVQMHDESMWLTQEQMAELFQRDKSVITRHINNIYAEGELEPKSTSAKNAFVPFCINSAEKCIFICIIQKKVVILQAILRNKKQERHQTLLGIALFGEKYKI